jgi:hypothetical protein
VSRLEIGKKEKGVKVFQLRQAWNRVEQWIFNGEWENFIKIDFSL